MKYINLYSRDLSTRKWPENLFFNLMAGGSAILITLFFIVAVVSFVRYKGASGESLRLKKEVAVLKEKDNQLSGLSVELKRLDNDNNILQESVNVLEGLSERSIRWTELVVKISDLINDSVWIDTIVTDTVPGLRSRVVNVAVSGGGLGLRDINEFVFKLENEFNNVKVSLKLTDEDDLKYYNYSLTFLWKVTSGERTPAEI